MRFRKRFQNPNLAALPVEPPPNPCFHLADEVFSPTPLETTFEPLHGEYSLAGRLPGDGLLDLGRHASKFPGASAHGYLNARRLLTNCGVFGGSAGERTAVLHRIGSEVRAKVPELAQLFVHLGPGASPYEDLTDASYRYGEPCFRAPYWPAPGPPRPTNPSRFTEDVAARLVAPLNLGEWYVYRFFDVFAEVGPPEHLADLPEMVEKRWNNQDHDPILVEWAGRHWPALRAARTVLSDPMLGRVLDLDGDDAPEWVRLFRDGCSVSIDLGTASPAHARLVAHAILGWVSETARWSDHFRATVTIDPADALLVVPTGRSEFPGERPPAHYACEAIDSLISYSWDRGDGIVYSLASPAGVLDTHIGLTQTKILFALPENATQRVTYDTCKSAALASLPPGVAVVQDFRRWFALEIT